MWHKSSWMRLWSVIGSRGRVVVGLALVVDLRYKAVVVVGMVGHMLCSTIWKCHCVRALDSACRKKVETIVVADN